MRSYAILMLVLALAGLCPSTASAVDPSSTLSDYLVTTWGRRDGLLSSFIRTIVQGGDGYIWLGTTDGLFRFDGVRLVQWRARAGHLRLLGIVNAVSVARSGGLWVGTESGILGRITDETLTAIDTGDPVRATLEARDGDVWVATDDRVLHYRAQSAVVLAGERQLPSRFVSGPVQAPDGSIWISTESGVVRVDPTADPLTVVRPGRVWLTKDATGEMWATTTDGTSVPIDKPHAAPSRAPRFDIIAVLRDSRGTTWIGTAGAGLVRVQKGASRPEVFTQSDGLANNSVWAVWEDREHNLWVGTQNGLQVFRDVNFKTRRWPHEINALVAGGDDSVWAATDDGVTRIDGRRTEFHRARDTVVALAADRRDRVWAATAAGMMVIDHGRSQTIPMPLGSHVADVTAIAVDDANVWLCDADHGLFRWANGRIENFSAEPALKRRSIVAANADRPGRLWLGLRDGGVLLFESNRFRPFDQRDGLPGGAVNSIVTDRTDITWVATESGLARFDGSRFTSWNTDQGLPGRRVIWVHSDAKNDLWLGFSFGVFHVAPAELDAAVRDRSHRLSATLYDYDDGIAGSLEYGAQATAVRAANGTLWFRTAEGVVSVDPADVVTNPVPPPVAIETMVADGRRIDLGAPVRLPPLTRSIEFDYTGLSLTAPRRVRFQYRLDGYDREWHDAGTRRHAIYTNLPPRAYRFRVLAANNDGVWSEVAATQSFMLLPAFYQTSWFRFAAAVAIGAVAWGAYRLRIRYLASRLRMRFDERLAERTRIARELHDNLLQRTLGISLQLEVTDELLPRDAPARRPLERALQLSKDAMEEGRRALSDLRTQTVDHHAILAAFSEAVKNIAPTRASDLRILSEGEPRPLGGVAGHEIMLIGREAIANALQHGQARRIHVVVSYSRDEFRLVVADNGKGMDEQTLRAGKPGHYGMNGMRERAERIGGTLRVVSQVTKGTDVVLTVPSHLIYAAVDESRHL